MRRLGMALLIAVLLALVATPVLAEKIKVWPAQESCDSPAFSGGETVDWINIQNAFESAQAGDTIHLEPGNYCLNRTVVAENFTGTFEGESRESVVIRAIRGNDGSGFIGYDDPNEPDFFGAPQFMFVIKTVGEATVKNLTMEVVDPAPCDEWRVWFYDPEVFGGCEGGHDDCRYARRRAPYLDSNALYGFLRIHPMLNASVIDNEIVVVNSEFIAADGDAPNGSNIHFGVLSNPGYVVLPRQTTFTFKENIVRNVGYVGVEAITYLSDMDFVAKDNLFFGGERLVFAWDNFGSGRIEIKDNMSVGAYWHPGNEETPENPNLFGSYIPFSAQQWNNPGYDIVVKDNTADPPPPNPYGPDD